MCKCEYGVCNEACVREVKCRCHALVELKIPLTPIKAEAGMVKIPPRENKAFMDAFHEAFGEMMSSVNLEWKCYSIWNAAKKDKKSK